MAYLAKRNIGIANSTMGIKYFIPSLSFPLPINPSNLEAMKLLAIIKVIIKNIKYSVDKDISCILKGKEEATAEGISI